MFTNAKVGDKVFSKYYGCGIIASTNWSNPSYPIVVKFKEANEIYTLNGDLWNERSFYYGTEQDKNITQGSSKVGSPDARRIVAMLAKEYRITKRQLPKKKYMTYYVGKAISVTDTYYEAYQQAKQLLGK